MIMNQHLTKQDSAKIRNYIRSLIEKENKIDPRTYSDDALTFLVNKRFKTKYNSWVISYHRSRAGFAANSDRVKELTNGKKNKNR